MVEYKKNHKGDEKMIENFATNLTKLRLNANLSQKDLATQLGVSTQTISNIEKGKAYPTFTNLEKIANYFEATPTQLFGTSKEIELEHAVLKSDEYSKTLKDILQKTDELNNVIESYFYKPAKFTYDPQYGEIYTYELSNGKMIHSSGDYVAGEEYGVNSGVYIVRQVKELSIYEKIMEMYHAMKEIEKNKKEQ